MADNGTDFSWNNSDAIAVRQQDAIAVYANPMATWLSADVATGTRMMMCGSLSRAIKLGRSSVRWKKS